MYVKTLIQTVLDLYPGDVGPPARIASDAECVTVVRRHNHQSLTDVHGVQHRLVLRIFAFIIPSLTLSNDYQ